ncbi:MAG: discoidin domain-containing protein, partial [Phycisphaeraceae bacterium]|nr:discoidin domain-containing protein [Phycisphaeraceae bacterium]
MSRTVLCFAILVCLLGFGITAQAQLFAPPINNPSFEATSLGTGGTGQWADYAEEWIIRNQGDCYLEDGTWEIAAPDGVATLKMWPDAAIWQQIGTWTPNTDYDIGLWIGKGLTTADVQVELWAGGNPDFVPTSGFGTIASTVSATLISSGPLVPTVPTGENEWMSLVLNTGAGFKINDALWLRIVSTGEAAWVDNVTVASVLNPAIAHHPDPASGSADVLRDGVVSWTPGIFAQKHDVYFGTNLNNVANASRTNPLGVLTVEDHNASTLEVGRLEFGQTYFWRVDEVNGAPDKTIHKGRIWSFEAEPYSIQVPGSSIGVTASSASNEYSIPERTIDGSGLDANDMHSISGDDMWFTSDVELDPWIQYEFASVQKLDTLKVWNSNSSAESAIGWGVKDVEIAYSVDGVTWDVLPDADQLSRAPGARTYDQPDEIMFGGVAAKFVRLNIASNWGGLLMSYGLSEVQFYVIPTQARTPVPASDSVDVLPDAIVQWRAGREAAEHVVYVSPDSDAVADGTAPSVTSTTNSLDLASLDLQLGQAYYWRVDEVNHAEVTTTWTGEPWTFSTRENLIVDDFESYNGLPVEQEGSHRVYVTWADGYAADPATNGSTMGYLDAPFLDSNDVHGGTYSVPLFYNNTTASLSEVSANTQDLSLGGNWSMGSPEALVLWLRGNADNDPATDQLYVKVGNAKVTYEGDISLAQWRQWSINLSAFDVDLDNVLTMTVGLERLGATGGRGVVLLDDIMLYGVAPVTLTQPDPEDNLTVNPSLESPDWESAGTGQWADNVDDWIINVQGNAYLEDGTWEIVAPDGVATLKMWHGGALWQQIGNV